MSVTYFYLSCFFLIFLSISPLAWSDARNFLAPKANTLLRLCPSALVTCPWMPASTACSAETRAAADLSASCLQSGRAKLSIYVQHGHKIFTVGLCLKGLSQPNGTINLWCSVKVVRKFQHLHLCSVLGSPPASLCGLGKAMWFCLFPHPTLLLCLYPVNENICPQTLSCVIELFYFFFFFLFVLSVIYFKSRIF